MHFKSSKDFFVPLSKVVFLKRCLQTCSILKERFLKRAPLGGTASESCSSKQMFYKLAAYLQKTFLKEHLWETASASKGVLLNRCFTNLQHICRTPFEKNTSEGLLLLPKVFF